MALAALAEVESNRIIMILEGGLMPIVGTLLRSEWGQVQPGQEVGAAARGWGRSRVLPGVVRGRVGRWAGAAGGWPEAGRC